MYNTKKELILLNFRNKHTLPSIQYLLQIRASVVVGGAYYRSSWRSSHDSVQVEELFELLSLTSREKIDKCVQADVWTDCVSHFHSLSLVLRSGLHLEALVERDTFSCAQMMFINLQLSRQTLPITFKFSSVIPSQTYIQWYILKTWIIL